jgi:hypothetical protein
VSTLLLDVPALVQQRHHGLVLDRLLDGVGVDQAAEPVDMVLAFAS